MSIITNYASYLSMDFGVLYQRILSFASLINEEELAVIFNEI